MGIAIFGLGILALLALAAGGGSQRAGAAEGDVRARLAAAGATLEALLKKYRAGKASETELLAGADLASKLGLPKTANSLRFSTPLPSDEFLPLTSTPIAAVK